MSTTPMHWRWFPYDDQMDLTDDQLDAYDLPDYPGGRTGEGVYLDLFSDPARTQPVGRLWTNEQTVGLLHVEDEDQVAYADAALRLRQMKQQDMTPREAFDALAEEFDAGPVYQGPLEDIGNPDLEENTGI